MDCIYLRFHLVWYHSLLSGAENCNNGCIYRVLCWPLGLICIFSNMYSTCIFLFCFSTDSFCVLVIAVLDKPVWGYVWGLNARTFRHALLLQSATEGTLGG